MNDSQSKPAGKEAIGLVPDELSNELYEFSVECESVNETERGELIRKMAERIAEMIEKNPENRDVVISRLSISSDYRERAFLYNKLLLQILFLITDPEREKAGQSKRNRGLLGKILRRRRS